MFLVFSDLPHFSIHTLSIKFKENVAHNYKSCTFHNELRLDLISILKKAQASQDSFYPSCLQVQVVQIRNPHTKTWKS